MLLQQTEIEVESTLLRLNYNTIHICILNPQSFKLNTKTVINHQQTNPFEINFQQMNLFEMMKTNENSSTNEYREREIWKRW